jgi:hypothetical protein
MAAYPCDWSSHRYPQAQQSAYVTIMNGDAPSTVKLRLCPKHLDDFDDGCRELLAPLNDDVLERRHCQNCDRETQQVVLAKVYRLHEEPYQYVGEFCAAHGSEVYMHLQIANGKALGDPRKAA